MFGKSACKIQQVYKALVPPRYRWLVQWGFIIIFLSAVLAVQFLRTDRNLQVYFYDVGQGDAVHIRTPEGFDVLIDGGPTSRVVEKLGRTMPFWDKTIELMVLTHPHADHVTGQIEVLRRFKINKVLATGVLHTTDEYLTWLKEIKERGVLMEIARAGMKVRLRRSRGQHTLGARSVSRGTGEQGDTHASLVLDPHETDSYKDGDQAGLRVSSSVPPAETTLPVLEILWPEESYKGERVAEGKIGEGGGLNDTSVVVKLTYSDTSFLFMGDATSAVEEELLDLTNTVRILSNKSEFEQDSDFDSDNIRENRLKADVLKVGHHGSKYSTTAKFLKAVQPRYAVIQVGQNRYGHPAFATLWRLNKSGAKVLRNDKDGDVEFVSDGQQVSLVRRK